MASLSIRVQLQITALIGERLCFAANLGPSDEDVADRAAFCRSLQWFQCFEQYPSLDVSMEENSNMMAHWPGQENRTGGLNRLGDVPGNRD